MSAMRTRSLRLVIYAPHPDCHGPQQRAIQVTRTYRVRMDRRKILLSVSVPTGWPAVAGHDNCVASGVPQTKRPPLAERPLSNSPVAGLARQQAFALQALALQLAISAGALRALPGAA